MRELLDALTARIARNGQHHRGGQIDKNFSMPPTDAYFVIRPVSRQQVIEWWGNIIYVYYRYKCRLQPVNLFGGRIISEDEDAEQVEIEFVPAWIDDTEEKNTVECFSFFSGYDEDTNTTSEDDKDHPFSEDSYSLLARSRGEGEEIRILRLHLYLAGMMV